MVTEAEIKASRDSGKRYLIAAKRVASYAPPPKISAGLAGMAGFSVGLLASIVFGPTTTVSSIFGIGLFTIVPAATRSICRASTTKQYDVRWLPLILMP
jgi:hypothetical protein